MNLQEALRLAISHNNAGRLGQAEGIYRAILEQIPNHPIAATLLARIVGKAGDVASAFDLLSRAIEAAPDYLPAHVNLGEIAEQSDERAIAGDAYRRALCLQPDLPGAWTGIANLRQLNDSLAPAVAGYRRALVLDGGAVVAANNMTAALLKQGEARAALEASQRVLTADFADVRANAHKTVALIGTGRVEEAGRLVGFGTLAKPIEFDFSSTEERDRFNAELTEALKNHPNLATDWDPRRRALRGGAAVPRLFDSQAPIITQFRDRLVAGLSAHISTLPEDSAHPFLGSKPLAYDFEIWGNLLSESHHQSAHIHNLGWMSGVYYVAVPEVAAGSEDRAGWIEFNRPGYGIPFLGSESAIQAIEPKPGMAILFPSYVWHATVPFSGPGERISIAFDLIPRR